MVFINIPNLSAQSTKDVANVLEILQEHFFEYTFSHYIASIVEIQWLGY